MFVVRNVFRAHPGKAKALVAIFKKAQSAIEKAQIVGKHRILTDAVSGFWTVVLEAEVEDLDAYLDIAKAVSQYPEIGEAMKGYIDLVQTGYREVLVLE
jgi:hypothetical protein